MISIILFLFAAFCFTLAALVSLPDMNILTLVLNSAAALTMGYLAFVEIRDYIKKKRPVAQKKIPADFPPDYRCHSCGATYCKLWRRYMSSCCELLCAKCAAKDQKEDISDIDADGSCYNRFLNHRMVVIGWYVPAVPHKESNSYWGYASIPPDVYDWWRKLPTHP